MSNGTRNGTVTPPEVEEGSRSGFAPTHPASAVDGVGGADWTGALRIRGVVPGNAAALVAAYAPQRIADAVAWFDEQTPGSVGPGVLVKAVKEGRVSPRRRSPEAENRAGWRRLWAWCAEQFPDLRDERGWPHHGVIGAVWLLGGPERVALPADEEWIRARARAWERMWGDESTEGVVA